ncbi:hypothetical protein QYM36_003024, partial [Artemia franciscana]
MSEIGAINEADAIYCQVTTEVGTSSTKRKRDGPPQPFIKKARPSVSPLVVVKENECPRSDYLETSGFAALSKNDSETTTREKHNECEENRALHNGRHENSKLHKITCVMTNCEKGTESDENSSLHNVVIENGVEHNSGNDKLQKSNSKRINCEKDNESKEISALQSDLNKDSALHYSENGTLSKNEGTIAIGEKDIGENGVLHNDQNEISAQHIYGDTKREKYNESEKHIVLHNDKNKNCVLHNGENSTLKNDSKMINRTKYNESVENGASCNEGKKIGVIHDCGNSTMLKINSEVINGDNGNESLKNEQEQKNKQKQSHNSESWVLEKSDTAVNLIDEKHETNAEPNTSRIDGSDSSSVKPDGSMVTSGAKHDTTRTKEKNNDAKTTSSRQKSQSPSKFTFIPNHRKSPEEPRNNTEIVRKSNRTPKMSQIMKEHEEGKKYFMMSETEPAGLPVSAGSESETVTRSARVNAGLSKGNRNKTSRPNKGKGRRKKGKISEAKGEPNLSIDPRFGGKVNIASSNKSKTEKQIELKGPKIKITGCPSLPKTIKFLDQEEENREKRVAKVIKDQQRFYKPTVFLTEDKNLVDKSWICLFCKKRSHEQGLGDLLGPYFVTTTEEEEVSQNTRRQADSKSIDEDELETWFHERCLYWAPNIYMLAGKIVGIQLVIKELQNSVCIILNMLYHAKFIFVQRHSNDLHR